MCGSRPYRLKPIDVDNTSGYSIPYPLLRDLTLKQRANLRLAVPTVAA